MGFASYVGDRFARQRTRREARRFQQECVPNHTYYSIEFCVQPWGDEEKLLTWEFRQNRRGDLKCGHLTPAGAWLQNGPLYKDNPKPHLNRIFERDGDYQSELNFKKALQALGRIQA